MRIWASVILASFAVGLTASLLSGGAAKLGLLESAELRAYDRLVPTSRCSTPAETVIVDFDDASVEAFNAFPLPRELLSRVVRRISEGRPELIGLDVLLDKPRDEAADAELAHAIEAAGNVILAEVFGTAGLPASTPLPRFGEAALDVAFVNTPLDADGFVRRAFLWMRTPDYEGLSFPVALASNYWQQPLQAGARGTYRLGDTEIPLDDTGLTSALIGVWCLPVTVSVRRLLDPGFNPELFEGKIVLVGQSSTVAKDLYATPLFRAGRARGENRLVSGAQIHAAALATLLSGKTVRVLPTVPAWLLSFLLAWLAAGIVVRARPAYGVAAVLAVAVGAFLLASLLFSEQQVWMGLVSTEAGILLTLPGGFGYRFLRERRLKALANAERLELMGLFERYVAPEVATEIWNRREEIVLRGQEKHATVLFSDIRGFTSLTAGRSSAEVLAWLNEYFDAMNEVIKRNGGLLNKFMGDGLLVVFGVPNSRGAAEDARRAVQAAREMLERVDSLNRLGRRGWPTLEIGIGLHTGPLTVGSVGARDRLEYSVIGETVNLASRLEKLTKEFETSVVMSPETRDLVSADFPIVPLGERNVRGLPDKVQLFTLANQSYLEAEA